MLSSREIIKISRKRRMEIRQSAINSNIKPRKEIKIEVLKSIEKQSGLEIREIFKNRNRK